NPTTLARATDQAHSCRRRIPIPVAKATIAANPLRKAWPAASKWAHSIERSTTTIQADAGHVGLRGPDSNAAVKRESRIERAAAKAKTQYGAPEKDPYCSAPPRSTNPPTTRLSPTNQRTARGPASSIVLSSGRAG